MRFRHDFYHLPAYVTRCAAEDHGEALAMLIETAGGEVFVPFVLRDVVTRGMVAGRDAATPYGYPGPLVRCDTAVQPDTVIAAAAAAFAEVGRDINLISAFIRMHPLLTPASAEWTRWGTLVNEGETNAIDLTLHHADWWARVRKDHRYEIRKLQRQGFVVEDDHEWKYLDQFITAYVETMVRVSASKHYFFDPAYFRFLRDAFRENAKLLAVMRDGAFAAGAIFIQTGDVVQYHLSGTRSELLRAAPSKLYFPLAFDLFRERGARVLHLGGGVGARKDGLFAFKNGFATMKQPFYTLRTILDFKVYTGLCREPSVAEQPAAGFFPAYRAPAIEA